MKNVFYFLSLSTLVFLLLAVFAEESVSKPGPRVIVLEDYNTISLNLPINGDSASNLQVELLEKASKTSKPLYLTLNSPGGAVDSGEKIIETANGIKNEVNTITLFAASMAFIAAQSLDKRYILDSGTMMSHRAFANGLSGNIPGNLITRTMAMLSSLVAIDQRIADRAGYTLKDYQDMVRDEMWIRGQDAVNMKFADEVIRVQCGKTLQGEGPEQTVKVFIFEVKVVYHKCPLITEPMHASVVGDSTAEQDRAIALMLSNRAEYVRQYGSKGLSN